MRNLGCPSHMIRASASRGASPPGVGSHPPVQSPDMRPSMPADHSSRLLPGSPAPGSIMRLRHELLAFEYGVTNLAPLLIFGLRPAVPVPIFPEFTVVGQPLLDSEFLPAFLAKRENASSSGPIVRHVTFDEIPRSQTTRAPPDIRRTQHMT